MLSPSPASRFKIGDKVDYILGPDSSLPAEVTGVTQRANGRLFYVIRPFNPDNGHAFRTRAVAHYSVREPVPVPKRRKRKTTARIGM